MNAPSRRYRLGIVGCGRAAGSLHLPALSHIPELEVVALADVDENALRQVGDQFHIRQRYCDVETMLSRSEIDIAAICAPVQFHKVLALPVLQAGKHLWVEKPLALDLESCNQLVAAAAGVTARTAVGFNLRFHRLVLQARDIIASGQLGEIEAVRSHWTSAIRYRQELPGWRNSRQTGGGALFEIAVHHFDLWRYLLATDLTEIFASDKSTEYPDESVAVTARLANGAVVSALFSERSSDANELEILGRKGRLSLNLFRHDGLEFTPISSKPGLSSRLGKLTGKLLRLPGGLVNMRRGGDFLLSYQEAWRQFVASVESGDGLHASLKDGRSAVRAVLAAIESTSSGQPVKL